MQKTRNVIQSDLAHSTLQLLPKFLLHLTWMEDVCGSSRRCFAANRIFRAEMGGLLAIWLRGSQKLLKLTRRSPKKNPLPRRAAAVTLRGSCRYLKAWNSATNWFFWRVTPFSAIAVRDFLISLGTKCLSLSQGIVLPNIVWTHLSIFFWGGCSGTKMQ